MNITKNIIDTTIINADSLQSTLVCVSDLIGNLREGVRCLDELDTEGQQSVLNILAFLHEAEISINRMEGQLLYLFTINAFKSKKKVKPKNSNIIEVDFKKED